MYKRNRVFIAACIGLLLFGIMLITLGSILPSVVSKFQLSKIASGRLAFILAISIIAGSLVFGPVADRYGYKLMFIITTLLMTIAFEGLAFANSIILLQLSIFLLGFSGGVINGATNAVVSDISEENKGANLSLLGAFFGIGALGMPLVLGLLSKRFEYPYIISSVGVLLLLATAYFATIRFPLPKHHQGFPVKEGIKLLKHPTLLLTSFFLFFQSGAESLINNWTTTFFQNDLNFSKEDALYALSFYLGGLTITRMLLGKLLKKISSFSVMIISLSLAVAGGFLLLYADSYALLVTALVTLGAGFAASFPVILSYIGHIYAQLSGTAFSIAFVIALTGNALINYSFGFISNNYGTKQLPVLLLCVIACLLIQLLLIKRNISSQVKM
ncbi:MAG TPA: MFS transporter [Chitinophagaceae bacterium]|nr:MFS transporter [Chitinophagaceae bacterium]